MLPALLQCSICLDICSDILSQPFEAQRASTPTGDQTCDLTFGRATEMPLRYKFIPYSFNCVSKKVTILVHYIAS